MRATIRIPSEQYAFIEVEVEATPNEIVALHDDLIRQVQERDGLGTREWAQARNRMLKTGEFDPNIVLNERQRYWVNETKNALRAIQREEKAENHLLPDEGEWGETVDPDAYHKEVKGEA